MEQLKHKFGGFFLIPEGGTNKLAVKGIEQFIKQLDTEADYVCCPVGTGGTMAGIITGLDENKKVIGFSALKDGSFLNKEVAALVSKSYANWQITTDYHFGGYAKTTPVLNAFIERFMELHGIPLDFVYTGKMMAGIFDLVSKGFLKKGLLYWLFIQAVSDALTFPDCLFLIIPFLMKLTFRRTPYRRRCGLLPHKLNTTHLFKSLKLKFLVNFPDSAIVLQ